MLSSCFAGFGFTLAWAVKLLYTIQTQALKLDVVKYLCILQTMASLFAIVSSVLYYFKRNDLKDYYLP